MQKLIALGFFTVSLLAQAAPDSCDDYFQRHNKADLVPIALRVSNVPKDGDLGPWQQAELRVQNQGSEPFLDNSAPGGLISHVRQLQISIVHTVTIQHYRRTFTHTFQGFMQAPLNGNAQTTVRFTLPANEIKNCEKVDVIVDSNRQVGQHGCEVFANDKANFTIRLIQPGQATRFCIGDIHHF